MAMCYMEMSSKLHVTSVYGIFATTPLPQSWERRIEVNATEDVEVWNYIV